MQIYRHIIFKFELSFVFYCTAVYYWLVGFNDVIIRHRRRHFFIEFLLFYFSANQLILFPKVDNIKRY